MIWIKSYWSLALLLLLQGIFLFWPIVDLKASAAAYTSPGGFALAGHWVLKGSDLLFGNLHWLLLLLLPLLPPLPLTLRSGLFFTFMALPTGVIVDDVVVVVLVDEETPISL